MILLAVPFSKPSQICEILHSIVVLWLVEKSENGVRSFDTSQIFDYKQSAPNSLLWYTASISCNDNAGVAIYFASKPLNGIISKCMNSEHSYMYKASSGTFEVPDYNEINQDNIVDCIVYRNFLKLHW